MTMRPKLAARKAGLKSLQREFGTTLPRPATHQLILGLSDACWEVWTTLKSIQQDLGLLDPRSAGMTLHSVRIHWETFRLHSCDIRDPYHVLSYFKSQMLIYTFYNTHRACEGNLSQGVDEEGNSTQRPLSRL